MQLLHRDRAPSANCAADHGDLTGPVLGFAVDAPVVVQRQVPGFDSGYIFCVSSRRASWTNSRIFYVKVELWILRSILVSLCKHGRRGSGALVVNIGSGMHFPGFAGKDASRAVSRRLPLGRLAHRRSVHSRSFGFAVSLGNSDIFPMSPLYLQTCSAVG